MSSSCRTSTSFSSFLSSQSFSPLLSLSLFLLFSLLSGCCAQPTSLSQVTILYVTGCTDTYPTTVNCTSPANITVWTSGLGQLVPTRLYSMTPTATSIVDCFLNPNDLTNSSVTATVSAVTYDSSWINSLINVALFAFSTGTGGNTPWFPGYAFAYEPPPTLTSISGCTGSGAATLNCAPDVSILTLQGSGLRWVARSGWWQIVIGSKGIQPSATIINDSYIIQPLTSVYYGTVLPEYYNNGPLPIYFKNIYSETRVGVQQTNALTISFIPLPPPSVTAVSVTGCIQSTGAGNTTTWVGCLAGTSVLTLSGFYLYSVEVTVGGQSCVLTNSLVNSITCIVPLTSAFASGMAYDVVVSNDNGQVTLPAYLSFSSAPALSYIAPCYPTIQYTYYPSVYLQINALCPPTYTITLIGVNFLNDPNVHVIMTSRPSVMMSQSVPLFNTTCLGAVVVNSSTVTCVLPVISNATLSAQLYGQLVNVQIFFPSSNMATNSLTKIVFASPSLPIVSSISSTDCLTSAGPLELEGCAPGSTITVTGVSLSTSTNAYANAFAGVTPTSNSQYLANVVPLNSTALLVVIPLNYTWQGLELQDGLIYNMYLNLVVNNTRLQSSSFFVSLTLPTTTPTGTSSSSSTLSSGAIAGIVVGITSLAVLLLAVALWLCRRRAVASPKDDENFTFAARPNQGGPASDSSSDAFSGVEMQ